MNSPCAEIFPHGKILVRRISAAPPCGAPGDNAAMGKSLRRLAALPPALPVYPGHGPATSIGRECRVNPFLQVLDLA